MIRVLHVFGQLDIGGAESRIMDLYRKIDKDVVQFDFVTHSTKKGCFEDEIEALGGHIYRVPRFKLYNALPYKKAFRRMLKGIMASDETRIKVIQGHMTSTASLYLPIAKSLGVDTTIAHVRSAGTDPGLKGLATKMMRINLSHKADYLFACSKIAAKAAFGNKVANEGRYIFIPNAINISEFNYDEGIGSEVRKELGISDNAFVIGHVGRFHYAKNHEYLLRLFKAIVDEANDGIKHELKNDNYNIRLLLIGDGPLFEEMKELSKTLSIDDKVIFTGRRGDAYRYYNAMNAFLYPSRYEGLPGAVVEAQANGLSCIISDTICDEVKVTDLVRSVSLDSNYSAWIDGFRKIYNSEEFSVQKRKSYNEAIKNAGFDADEQAKKMLNFYTKGIIN